MQSFSKHVNVALLVSLVTCFVARAQESAPHPGEGAARIGTYTTKLTERSPLTEPKELAKRLGEKTVTETNDFARQEFLVHVPDDYDPARPMGLLVWLSYKNPDEPPVTVLDILKQRRLIFVSPKVMPATNDGRCAVAVDAVHGMKQRYAIDDRRVFLLCYVNPPHPARIAFAAPDVFTGSFLRWASYFKKVTDRPTRKEYPPMFATPPEWARARAHPFVLSSDQPELLKLIMDQMRADGFKRLKAVETNYQNAHYPDPTPKWFTEVIEFLDQPPEPAAPTEPAAVATAPAATAPAKSAAAPAADEPKQMLSMAKSYIAANRVPQARARLQTLIEKHPNTPEAAEAKRLLKQLDGK